MAEKWYDGLPDEAMMSETEKIYMKALNMVRSGLAKGLDFDKASEQVEIEDETLRLSVLDDVLKVIIAEEHFVKHVPIEKVAGDLKLPVERIEKARAEMIEDVQQSAVKAFYANTEKGTLH